MAKRNRYRRLEIMMTRIIFGITAVFVSFILFSWFGLNVWKLITGLVTIVASVLGMGWLYLTGEFQHRRSLWMITAFGAFIVCTLVSLLLGYPCPPVAAG